MAIMKFGPAAIISGLALAGLGAAGLLIGRDGKPAVRTEPAAEDPAPAGSAEESAPVPDDDAAEVLNVETPAAEAPAFVPPAFEFTIGSLDDLRKDQLSAIVAKVAEVEGVAEKTKVWVATADVASAPGVETFYHIKGPLTCGRIGCDLLVVSASKAVLLETVGEGVAAPEFDMLVVNQGTGSAVTWVFDGSAFVERR